MIMNSVAMTLNLLQMEWPWRAKWNGGVNGLEVFYFDYVSVCRKTCVFSYF